MRIARFIIFVIAAALLNATVTVMLREAGVHLGALPTMLKVAACWGIVYVIVYHVFGATKKQTIQQSQGGDEKSDI